MFIFSPTRRANPERLALAGLLDKDVNGDCVRFLYNIRDDYGNIRNEFSLAVRWDVKEMPIIHRNLRPRMKPNGFIGSKRRTALSSDFIPRYV